jgi:hypothetical protein
MLGLVRADDGHTKVIHADPRRYSKMGQAAQRLWLCATAEDWMSS